MNTRFTAALLASASIVAFSALPQAAQAQMFEEIVVTAQKRDQSLSDVGVSVTAFSGESIERLGFTNSVDIVAQVPGLNVGTPVGEGNNPAFTLRGVGLNDFNDNSESPIAIYQDGVYVSALAGMTFQLFDVERVEVLRGPQGTLYGRNATGGLIHFISKKPTDEFEAYARATYGSYNQIKLEGAISGPLSDTVSGRLSFSSNNHDGYNENRIGRDGNEADSKAVRGLLDFKLADNHNLMLKGYYSKADTIAAQYQHVPSDGVSDIYGYSDTDGDTHAGAYDRAGALNIEAYGVSGTYEGTWGEVDVTNVLSYSKTDKFHQEDTDAGPVSGILPTFQANIRQISEELTFSGGNDKFNWVLGGFFFDTKVVGKLDLLVNWYAGFANAVDSDPTVFDGLLGAGTPSLGATADDVLLPAIGYDVDYTQDTQSISGYGQVEYNLDEKWKVTFGLRYTNEKRHIEYLNAMPAGYLLNDAFGGVLGMQSYMDFRTGANNNGTGIPGLDAGAVGNLNDNDFNNVSGKVGLDYAANDDLLLYVSVSRGFKSGGFNAGFLDATDGLTTANVPYDSEKLTSYEAGFKWNSTGGMFRVNGAAFYYDYKDFQALGFSGLSQFITNSDATYKGMELEVGATPAEGLSIQLGASYLDAQVDGVFIDGVYFPDVTPVLAPEFTANGLVHYEKPVTALKGIVGATVSFNHQGSHYFDITNSASSKQKAYTLVDARLSWMSENESVELAAFAKNIFGKDYNVYSFDFTGTAGFLQEMPGRPKWFGAELTLRY
ncbi:TonB-dependent receptor [Kordiimonas pumila]|uniref:TonB-dependent receptor n=1 Tax=Kordiimonas pumila TaxID=2161677 RepID=A0ABV7D4N0_9PROT|nr:TonB-dependent receptor [Kordiimonas pumila]